MHFCCSWNNPELCPTNEIERVQLFVPKLLKGLRIIFVNTEHPNNTPRTQDIQSQMYLK